MKDVKIGLVGRGGGRAFPKVHGFIRGHLFWEMALPRPALPYLHFLTLFFAQLKFPPKKLKAIINKNFSSLP
jgi:hypothetical protein